MGEQWFFLLRVAASLDRPLHLPFIRRIRCQCEAQTLRLALPYDCVVNRLLVVDSAQAEIGYLSRADKWYNALVPDWS